MGGIENVPSCLNFPITKSYLEVTKKVRTSTTMDNFVVLPRDIRSMTMILVKRDNTRSDECLDLHYRGPI